MSTTPMVAPARRTKLPAALHTIVALAILVAIAQLALRANQAPLASIAEFAPQAKQPIKQAPNEQTGLVGNGPGGAGIGTPTPSPSPTPAAGSLASSPTPSPPPQGILLKCVGDPPRQIEDPQSPPCVPSWPATNNGGSTWKGVSDIEIRIGESGNDATITPYLQAFFNNRFEFYGRHLNLLATQDSGNCSASSQQSDAVYADQQVHIFADMNVTGCGGFYTYGALAGEQIVSAATYSIFTESDLAAHEPYMWQYGMSTDKEFRMIGDWACSRLAGHAASHAGPGLNTQTRRFGIITNAVVSPDPVDTSSIEQTLAACNSPVADVEHLENSSNNFGTAIINLKTKGVTSVICLCIYDEGAELAGPATSQDYYPEWLLSSYVLNDENYYLKGFWPADQLQHAFGLTFAPRQVAPANDPSFWAQAEVDPNPPASSQTAYYRVKWHTEYRSLLLLASGIQMAGPDLTPTSFQDGLFRTTFPNPDTPIMAGHVGFPDDHSMTLDAAEWWWSNTARSPFPGDSGGTICYVDGGARHTLGTFPHGGDPFFTTACDSGG